MKKLFNKIKFILLGLLLGNVLALLITEGFNLLMSLAIVLSVALAFVIMDNSNNKEDK